MKKFVTEIDNLHSPDHAELTTSTIVQMYLICTLRQRRKNKTSFSCQVYDMLPSCFLPTAPPPLSEKFLGDGPPRKKLAALIRIEHVVPPTHSLQPAGYYLIL